MTRIPDFDDLYRRDSDPWQVRSSFYEQRKLALLLACLDAPTYRVAWDPACGVGEFAARLAPRTEQLLATDASAEAVELTRRRCVGLPQVKVFQHTLPAASPRPQRDIDLVLLAEFVYYLDAEDRAATLTMVDAVTSPDAEVVSVHWRYRPHDAWLSGEDVQTEVVDTLQALGWQHRVQHDDRDFVVNCLRRESSR